MAYCPKCQGEMKTMDTVCPHCGYDFPDDNPFQKEEGVPWPFASWTSLLLDVAQFIAGVGCVLAVLASVAGLFGGQVNVLEGLVVAILMAALVIVIGRVKYIEPRPPSAE